MDYILFLFQDGWYCINPHLFLLFSRRKNVKVKTLSHGEKIKQGCIRQMRTNFLDLNKKICILSLRSRKRCLHLHKQIALFILSILYHQHRPKRSKITRGLIQDDKNTQLLIVKKQGVRRCVLADSNNKSHIRKLLSTRWHTL